MPKKFSPRISKLLGDMGASYSPVSVRGRSKSPKRRYTTRSRNYKRAAASRSRSGVSTRHSPYVRRYGDSRRLWSAAGSGARGVGRAAKYTAKKGYQGVVYVSPKIYSGGRRTYEYLAPKIVHGSRRAYEVLSPMVASAARATGRGAHRYVLSPTYDWLSGHARRAGRSAAARARAFHEYMMSP